MKKRYFIASPRKVFMRRLAFIVLLFVSCLSNAQTRTIKGKVVEENDLIPMPGVKVQDRDTVLLATTDQNGNFEIQLPSGKDELLLSFISMEWTSIKVPASCNNLEIVMMVDAIYDYISVKKANKKRCKRFKELPNKHRQAFEKGVFTSDSPCGTYIFHKY